MRVGTLFLSLALTASVLAACSHSSEGPGSAPSAEVLVTAPTTRAAPRTSAAGATPEPAPQPSAASPPGEPPAAFVQAMVAAEEAVDAGDYARADRQIDAAAAASGSNSHLHYFVAIYRATRFAYAGDFDRAAAALTAVIPELAKHPESPDEFAIHNQMMLVRVAQGDPAAALAEDDQATLAASRGTWSPQERPILAYLKDRWHRAYLSRMLAETRAGAAKQALIHDAEAALDDYRAHARKLGTNEESIAVLEAYFAALDGKRDVALRAARRVDPAKDDDIEDLYLVVVGLEAGGDHAAAERVRQKIRQPGNVHISRPILLRWLEHDAKVPRDKTFTPWHPS